jgi:hypothetical protein
VGVRVNGAAVMGGRVGGSGTTHELFFCLSKNRGGEAPLDAGSIEASKVFSTILLTPTLSPNPTNTNPNLIVIYLKPNPNLSPSPDTNPNPKTLCNTTTSPNLNHANPNSDMDLTQILTKPTH